MILKTVSYGLWFVSLKGLGLLLSCLPLFNLLGFEFCTVVAIGISFAAAQNAIVAVQRFKSQPYSLKGSSHQVVMGLFWMAFVSSVILLVAPLVIVSLNAQRVKNCDLLQGFAFY